MICVQGFLLKCQKRIFSEVRGTHATETDLDFLTNFSTAFEIVAGFYEVSPFAKSFLTLKAIVLAVGIARSLQTESSEHEELCSLEACSIKKLAVSYHVFYMVNLRSPFFL